MQPFQGNIYRNIGLVIVILLMIAAQQSSQPSQQPPANATPKVKAGERSSAEQLPRSPLLREGSFLVEVKGIMGFNDKSKWWRFTIDSEDPKHPSYELSFLPCTLMSNMRQITQSMSNQQVKFETTGQVFVYHGRNFFLPAHAPRVVEVQQKSSMPDKEETASDDVDETDAANEIENSDQQDDSAEAILRGLEQGVGPVVRSTGGEAKEQKAELKLTPEGTQVINRRGRMHRGVHGTWWFTFDADASGLSDPPMVILPCLLLERMERYAARSGARTAMLLSGRVYVYEDRNYILPTMFQIPRQRTTLNP